jgi:hypothetical protein
LSFREKFLNDFCIKNFVGVSPALALRGRAIRCKSSFAALIAGFPLLSLTRICTRTYTLCIRVRHAEGMRSMVRQAPKRSVARSTPTAQQERPNKTFINNVLMHHPKSRIERKNNKNNLQIFNIFT